MSDKIEKLSHWYGNTELDFDRELISYRYKSIRRYFKGDSCLEIGPAQGIMTQLLVKDFKKITLAEASANLLRQIPDYKNVTKIHSTIEDFDNEDLFDTIILDHVLEHIEHPVKALKRISKSLKKNGVFIIGVPNAKSLHRMLGVKMGKLKSVYTLNERDKELGHYRVYDIDTLNSHVIKAGMKVKANDGVFLKLLSNKQIQDTFTQEMKDGCYELGKEFKDNTAEIYCIATK